MNQGGTLCEKYNLHWHAWGGQDNHWKRSGTHPGMERYALYLAAADLHISVRGGIKETVEAVLAALREQGVVEG